jgi:hypothetical protein
VANITLLANRLYLSRRAREHQVSFDEFEVGGIARPRISHEVSCLIERDESSQRELIRIRGSSRQQE